MAVHQGSTFKQFYTTIFAVAHSYKLHMISDYILVSPGLLFYDILASSYRYIIYKLYMTTDDYILVSELGYLVTSELGYTK